MRAFAPYPVYLEAVVQRLTSGPTSEVKGLVDAALDGQASRELRRLVPLQALRDAGAFFTGSTLSQRATTLLLGDNPSDMSVIDPACGAGDLLLAYSRHLPAERTWKQTVECWNNSVFGLDLQPHFIRAAQLRLAIAAWQATHHLTGLDPGPAPSMSDLFPGVRVGSGFELSNEFENMEQILLNPPFTHSIAPTECQWASGRTSTAALFLVNCLEKARKGANLVAILPDVLRSGSRYKRFRQYVESKATIREVRIFGRFDSRTDVDVFLLLLQVHEVSRAEENQASVAE